MSDEQPPEEKKVRGKPFFKGDDPRRKIGGSRYRDEGQKAIAQLARDYSATAFQRVVDIIEHPDTKPRDVINAAVAIWNRGNGMPSQHFKHEATVQVETTTIDVTQLTAEVRRQLLAAKREADLLPPPSLMIEDASYTEVDSEGTDE